MTLTQALVSITVALLSGGVGVKMIDALSARWKASRGRRRTHDEEINLYRERLARARILAIQAGVKPEDLPDDPRSPDED